MRKTILILAGLASLAAAAPAFAHDYGYGYGYGEDRRERADIQRDRYQRDMFLRKAEWARYHGDWRAARYWEERARAVSRDIRGDKRELREDRRDRY